jgi:trk system potassium uptake protein TrkH
MRPVIIKRPGPAGFLAASFGGLIFLGSFALMLDVMQGPAGVSALDCFFTATSAVCVTGLITVDTATAWSPLGQALIGLLIQLGGLGIMAFSVGLLLAAGRRLSPGGYLKLGGIYGSVPAREMGGLIRDVLLYTLIWELAGSLVLFLCFWGDFTWPRALALALFHAVSAFCNAGFSLFSDSLEGYTQSWVVSWTVMLLFIGGGLGFVVQRELRQRIKGTKRRLSLHTRSVLGVSLGLWLGGALLIWILESMGGGSGLLPALFTSATARTAGFNTTPMGAFSNASLLVVIFLMFIGASPGSTGGGIKTTSLATLFALARSRLSGRDHAMLSGRTIPVRQVGEALTLVLGAGAVVSLGSLILIALEGGGPGQRGEALTLVFEAMSAFATVGLSLGATPELSPGGKLVVMALMFIGRLGPLTFIYAVAGRFEPARLQPAEEEIMLG